MFRCLVLIFPLLIAENENDGILNGPEPKPLQEFLDEYHPPSTGNIILTVISVSVIQKNGQPVHILKLSNEEVFVIHPNYVDIAEGWVLGPEVEVTMSKKIEGYPYKITRKGNPSSVYGRKYIEDSLSIP
jgi:hypothetical protein